MRSTAQCIFQKIEPKLHNVNKKKYINIESRFCNSIYSKLFSLRSLMPQSDRSRWLHTNSRAG